MEACQGQVIKAAEHQVLVRGERRRVLGVVEIDVLYLDTVHFR